MKSIKTVKQMFLAVYGHIRMSIMDDISLFFSFLFFFFFLFQGSGSEEVVIR